MLKKCSRCKLKKNYKYFSKNKCRKDGLTNYCKQCLSLTGKKREKTISRIFYRYKKSAKDRGYEFKLGKKELKLLLNKECFYCKQIVNEIGIDRRDNLKGYTIKNAVSCCKKCNYMKGKLGEQDFLNHCKLISNINVPMKE